MQSDNDTLPSFLEPYKEEPVPDYVSTSSYQERIAAAGTMSTSPGDIRTFQVLCEYLQQRENAIVNIKNFTEHVYKKSSIKGVSTLENVQYYLSRFVERLCKKEVDLAYVLKNNTDHSPQWVVMKQPGKLTFAEKRLKVNHFLHTKKPESKSHSVFPTIDEVAEKTKITPQDIINKVSQHYKVNELNSFIITQSQKNDSPIVISYENNTHLVVPSKKNSDLLVLFVDAFAQQYKKIEDPTFQSRILQGITSKASPHFSNIIDIANHQLPADGTICLNFVNLFNNVIQQQQKIPVDDEKEQYKKNLYYLSKILLSILMHTREETLKQEHKKQIKQQHLHVIFTYLLTNKKYDMEEIDVDAILYQASTLDDIQTITVPILASPEEQQPPDTNQTELLRNLYSKKELSDMIESACEEKQPILDILIFNHQGIVHYLHRLRLISIVYSAIKKERNHILKKVLQNPSLLIGGPKKDFNNHLEAFLRENISTSFPIIMNLAKATINATPPPDKTYKNYLLERLFMQMSEAIRYKMRRSNLMLNTDESPLDKKYELELFIEKLYQDELLTPRPIRELLNMTRRNIIEIVSTSKKSLILKLQFELSNIINLFLLWIKRFVIGNRSPHSLKKSSTTPSRSARQPESFLRTASKTTIKTKRQNLIELKKIAPLLQDLHKLDQLMHDSHEKWNQKLGLARSSLKEYVDACIQKINKRLLLTDYEEKNIHKIILRVIEHNKSLQDIKDQKNLVRYMVYGTLLDKYQILMKKYP